MKKFKLVPERHSPNVTVNIPHAFRGFQEIVTYESYVCSVNQGVYVFDHIGTYEDKKRISDAFYIAFSAYRYFMYPVNVTGLKDSGGEIGSNRFCTMSEILAEYCSTVIAGSSMLDIYPGDTEDIRPFLGVSRYFRAMDYLRGGEHFPHYDSDYMVRRAMFRAMETKMSLVMYGDDCDSGEIAFVHHNPDFVNSDWNRQATDSEIFLRIAPEIGRIVVFDHSLCHTVLPYTDETGQRRILRGDLIF